MALYGGLKSDNIAFIIMKSICFRIIVTKIFKKKKKENYSFSSSSMPFYALVAKQTNKDWTVSE